MTCEDLEKFVELCNDDVDTIKYVREYLSGVSSGDEARELQSLRSKLNAMNLQSSESVKKNLFLSYQQFIRTSKEISHLEREIYELSSLLSEQKLLIENLMQMNGEDRLSICTSSSYNTSNTSSHINILLQKMDGIAGILSSLPSSERVLMYGDVIQLDFDHKRPINSAFLVLLSDRLLIGHPSSGKYRFQLESSHHLNALAAVNIKDRNGGEASVNSFKLLIFPDQRVYQTESNRSKCEWLESIENAKRNLLNQGLLVRQATIRGRRKHSHNTGIKNEAVSSKMAPIIETKVSDESAWLSEIPAELDDCIAHRDMEQAVELICEWKSCSSRSSNVDAQMVIRERQVVQILIDEVKRPGALHGGPRAVRKAINLLTNLGRSYQAVELYLKKRSAMLRINARELTMSEEPLSYVRQLSQQLLGAISDVAAEFTGQPEHYSLILQWCSLELSLMLSLIRRHVIEVAPTISVLSHTWRILMSHCESLVAIGIDLSFEMNHLLAPSIRSALELNFDNIIESVRLRIAEERWHAYNMESEQNINRFLEEMSDLGLCVDWTVSNSNRYCIDITQNACHFARVAHSLSRDLSTLRSSQLSRLTDSYMIQLWTDYLEHLLNSSYSSIQQKTCTFIISQLLPLCDSVYNGSRQGILHHLLCDKFAELMKYLSPSCENCDSNLSDEEIAHV